MPLRTISLDNISETAYLNAENASRYRGIMRTFYLEAENANYRLNKEQIFALLRENRQFADYTLAQLDQDLNALCGWRNLVPIQDSRKPTTIEEYKNKQYLYFMSPAATEVERMTLSLENLSLQTTVLSSQLFVRLLDRVENLQALIPTDQAAVLDWWDGLQQDFTQLTKSYQDYLRDFYSSHAEHTLRTEAFLLHKDQVIRYLRDFVLELQRHVEKIRRQLELVPSAHIEALLRAVWAAQLEAGQGRLIERDEDYEERLNTRIQALWQNFYHWFIPGESGQSESQRVVTLANGIIQRILMNAELIIQAHSGGADRKNEYRKFLEIFSGCATLEEAHRFSALAFGAQTAFHLKGDGATELYDSAGCYDAQPFLYLLHNRQRPGRAPSEKSQFEDKSLEKQAQRTAYIRQKEKERLALQQFIGCGHLDLSELTQTVTPEIRRHLLGWIAKANAVESKTARTEYGQRYVLHFTPGASCTLHCTDGDLVMPACCLDFETEDHHG